MESEFRLDPAFHIVAIPLGIAAGRPVFTCQRDLKILAQNLTQNLVHPVPVSRL
jgi:hypothetical protein